MSDVAERERLQPKQAAALVGVSLHTLAKWRQRKVGPRFYRKVGRIFYLKSDLETWELSNPGN